MTSSGPDLKRFGEIVRKRREELGLRQDQLPKGPSTTALTGIENGRVAPTAATLRKLDASLRWTSGSAKKALGGGEPTPLSAQPLEPTPPQPERKPYDPLSGARHNFEHVWGAGEDLVNEVLALDPPNEVKRLLRAVVAYALTSFMADQFIEFSITREERDELLAELYRRRDRVIHQIGEIDAVENAAPAGASDEAGQGKEGSAASAAQGYDPAGGSGGFSAAVFSAIADAPKDEQDGTRLGDSPGATGDAG